jgi:hypothetical protein
MSNEPISGVMTGVLAAPVDQAQLELHTQGARPLAEARLFEHALELRKLLVQTSFEEEAVGLAEVFAFELCSHISALSKLQTRASRRALPNPLRAARALLYTGFCALHRRGSDVALESGDSGNGHGANNLVTNSVGEASGCALLPRLRSKRAQPRASKDGDQACVESVARYVSGTDLRTSRPSTA